MFADYISIYNDDDVSLNCISLEESAYNFIRFFWFNAPPRCFLIGRRNAVLKENYSDKICANRIFL